MTISDPFESDPLSSRPTEEATLPHSPEAEEAVLGCVLINPECYDEALEVLSVKECFYILRHQWIWEVFGKLQSSRIFIDLVTVSDELRRQGKLQEVGGDAFLTKLINAPASSLNVIGYATVMEGDFIRRGMVKKANTIASNAFNKTLPLEEVMNRYDKLTSERTFTSSTLDDTEDSDIASLKLIEKIQSGTPTGVKTYFPIFDKPESMGGLPIGATLLCGDSSFGKSAWALQLCEQSALNNIMACYLGLESTNSAMVMRRVGGASGINAKKVRTATLTPQEQATVISEITNSYQGRYNGCLKLNSNATTLRDIERVIRIHKPKLAVVDQISQITDTPTNNPTMNLLMNFTRLKQIGNRHECAMLVIHALSPDESRQFFKKNQKSGSSNVKQRNSVPDLNAIPWASQMKFLADVMLFLVPEVNQKLSKATVYEILIWIMKDRDGARFLATWWDYDLIMQWFKDKYPPTTFQQPTGVTAFPDVTQAYEAHEEEPADDTLFPLV